MENRNMSFTIIMRCAALATTAFATACSTTMKTAMSTAVPATSPMVSSDSAAIDSTVRSIFALDISPGIGVVVVRDTSIIYVAGLGYADREAQRPFVPTTEFYIASTTKSFTGLAAAILDGEGRFQLDAPLSRYLPGLKLHTPLQSDSISILSLLTHTHGISGDGPVTTRLAYTGEYSGDAQLIALLASHKPSEHGRAYQYGNIGYNVATLAMDAATGKSWRTVLDQRIFQPLGMHNTSTYISAFPTDSYAMPYTFAPAQRGFERVRFGKFDDNMQSAGGIVTTPVDMGRWLVANINNGRVDGQQVIPAAAFRKAHRNYLDLDIHSHGEHQIGYALGWRVADAGRDTMLVHGGGFTGFATYMSFIPERRIGVAVMANNSEIGNVAVSVIADAIYKTIASGHSIEADSLATLSALFADGKRHYAEEIARRASRPQNLPLPLTAYAGSYVNADWGTLIVAVINGKLVARMGRAESAVEVYDATRGLMRFSLFGSGTVVTPQVEDGRVMALEMDGVKYVRAP
jgi:CubicO group peptidase (beta-lactamase class C family)